MQELGDERGESYGVSTGETFCGADLLSEEVRLPIRRIPAPALLKAPKPSEYLRLDKRKPEEREGVLPGQEPLLGTSAHVWDVAAGRAQEIAPTKGTQPGWL